MIDMFEVTETENINRRKKSLKLQTLQEFGMCSRSLGAVHDRQSPKALKTMIRISFRFLLRCDTIRTK